MALTADDLDTLRTLLREELATKEEIETLRSEMSSRFDIVSEQILGLYERDEKREQEYLFMREAVRRLEEAGPPARS